MKHLFNASIIVAGLAFILLTSCGLPGSDLAKIKSATGKYVKTQLGEGEKYQWGGLERKCGRYNNGRDCKYAEVHYNIINPAGKTEHKMLFLLMSEHCDSVYDVTDERNKEWVSEEGLSAEDMKALIEEALNK